VLCGVLLPRRPNLTSPEAHPSRSPFTHASTVNRSPTGGRQSPRSVRPYPRDLMGEILAPRLRAAMRRPGGPSRSSRRPRVVYNSLQPPRNHMNDRTRLTRLLFRSSQSSDRDHHWRPPSSSARSSIPFTSANSVSRMLSREACLTAHCVDSQRPLETFTHSCRISRSRWARESTT
jgi:hypothetical protein